MANFIIVVMNEYPSDASKARAYVMRDNGAAREYAQSPQYMYEYAVVAKNIAVVAQNAFSVASRVYRTDKMSSMYRGEAKRAQ